MQTNDNLNNYKLYPDTNSCYLDGRYFNKVLESYPGLITEPLNIIINKNQETNYYMKSTELDNRYPGLLRVIINTPKGRHSNLLIIDYKNSKVFRFDPNGQNSPYFNQVNTIIQQYLGLYLDFELFIIDPTISLTTTNTSCNNNTNNNTNNKSGFCVAYVIKYAYDYLQGRDFDPSHILKFTQAVETIYGPLPQKGKDIEYGIFGNDNPDQGRNIAIGAIGGALIGGVLTGGLGGAVVGGAGGGLIGGLI